MNSQTGMAYLSARYAKFSDFVLAHTEDFIQELCCHRLELYFGLSKLESNWWSCNSNSRRSSPDLYWLSLAAAGCQTASFNHGCLGRHIDAFGALFKVISGKIEIGISAILRPTQIFNLKTGLATYLKCSSIFQEKLVLKAGHQSPWKLQNPGNPC